MAAGTKHKFLQDLSLIHGRDAAYHLGCRVRFKIMADTDQSRHGKTRGE